MHNTFSFHLGFSDESKGARFPHPSFSQIFSKTLSGRESASFSSVVKRNMRPSLRMSSTAATARIKFLHRAALEVMVSTRNFLMPNFYVCFFCS